MSEKVKKAEATLIKSIDKINTLVVGYEKKLEEKQENFLSGGEGPTIITRSRAGSYENKLMDTFACKSLPELCHKNVCAPEFQSVPLHLKNAVIQLKSNIDIGRYIAQIFHDGRMDRDTHEETIAVKGILDSYYGKTVIAPLIKSFGSGGATTGGDWIPTLLSSQFVEEFQLERKIANEWQQLNVDGSPWELPVQSETTTARIATEKVALTDANFQTSKLTFTAVKFGEFYCLPEELNEDAAPQILAIARREVVESQIRAKETAPINGDSDGTHQDADTQALGADVAEKAVDGIRKLSLANSANGGDVDFSAAAITTANLDLMRNQMGKFGVNVNDLRWVVGPTGYHQMVALPEVSSVDQIGNNATLLSGTLAAFRGSPIIISESVREVLNAAGVEDGVTVDKAVVHLVNMKRFYIGMRRAIRTRVMMDLPNQDQWLLASYSRWDFQGHVQSATETSVVTGRNIQT